MPRIKKIDRPISVEVYLPGTIHSMVKEELYSEIEGRVPFGAFTKLGTQLFTEWLRSRGKIV